MHEWRMWKRVVMRAAVMTGAFFVVLAGAASDGASQETAAANDAAVSSERVFTLGEVEVVGKDDEAKNATIQKVYEDDMRLFDANNVAEAANLIPGVTLSHGGARNEVMLYVRGFDIKHVPIFVDGIPVYVPYDGYPDLARFMTYDLSEVVVSKGFTSVLYGPNTMGGAINMVSKKPVKPFEMTLGSGFASGDAYNVYGNFGTKQHWFYVQGGGSYSERDHYRVSEHYSGNSSEDGGERENSYATDWKGSVKVGLTPNETDEYAVSYVNQHGEKGVPPYAGDSAAVTTRYWQWPYWDKESYYFNSNTAIGGSSYVKTRAYYDSLENSLYAYDDDTYSTMRKKSSFKSWYDDHTAGGSLEVGTALIPRNMVKLALHYKDDVHKEHNAGEPIRTFEDEIFSVGLEDTIDITKQLYTIIGVGYDRVNTVEAEDYNSTTRQVTDFDTGDTSSFTPQIGLFYKVGEDGLAHASVASKSRIPSIKDKYSYKMGTALPNPDLDAETSINYELGYEHLLFKKVKVEATFFYYDISDYILQVVIPDPSNSKKTLNQNQNIGDVNQYGFEVGFSGQLLSTLRGGVNYTHLWYDNETNSNKLTDVPKDKFFGYLEYRPIQKLSILADVEYDSKRFSSSDGLRVADGYTLVNGKVGYEVLSGLTAEVGVDNIFDEDYELDEGFPEEGRSFFANLRYKF